MARPGGVRNERRIEMKMCDGEVERGGEVFCGGHSYERVETGNLASREGSTRRRGYLGHIRFGERKKPFFWCMGIQP